MIVCVLQAAVSPLCAHAGEEQQGAARSVLDWHAEASDLSLPARQARFYVRIRIKAVGEAQGARPPLHLALVFDRSGSMGEESKIGFVRAAAHLVADNLTPQDRLAMIAYADDAQTLVPLHPVVNREYLHHRIDELYAEGYTNLSAGLLEGCAQVEKRLDQPGLHHVIILTDGLANRGVTDAKALVAMARRSNERRITVTTIGVGADYNETLLGRLAEAGGGRYVYVAQPDQIPAAFQEELGSLLTVVAQNVRLKIEFPTGVELEQVYGRDAPLEASMFEASLGDFTSGDERVLLAKFRVVAAAATQGAGRLELRWVLTYDDVAAAERIEAEQAIAIDRVPGNVEDGQTKQDVLDYARLVEAVDKIALAVNGMDRRLAAEVLQIRRREYPALKQAARASRDQDFVNKAFMFEHYARELEQLIDQGALHEHSLERARLQKDLHYRRYLMDHHRHAH